MNITPIKTPKQPTHRELIERIYEANSITNLMGWAALGAECAGESSQDAPAGFDYTNAAKVVNRLLTAVCSDLETLQSQTSENQEPNKGRAQA